MVDSIESNPHRLFLLDGSGALLSAICLGVLLPAFPSFFGMRTDILLWLAAGAIILAFNAFSAWFFGRRITHGLLKVCALGNLLYSLVSIAFLWLHASELKWAGWLYFVGELLIVLSLAVYEWCISLTDPT